MYVRAARTRPAWMNSAMELTNKEARYRSREHGPMTITSSSMMRNQHVAS
jgi:hypothetical protein